MENRKLETDLDKIMYGLELTFEKLIKFKQEKGTPFVFSENGKIVYVYPEEILAQRKAQLEKEKK